jgi:putative DeoR family transcriptional regulator (stage III sporulation protein D)
MIYISRDKERCESIALYMLENRGTVRSAASYFGISKSTVHKDVSQTLKRVNKSLYERVCELLETNKLERHIRGGEATKRKYELFRNKNINNNYTT